MWEFGQFGWRATFEEADFSGTIEQLRNPHGQIVGHRWNNFRVAHRSGAIGRITNQNPKRPGALPPASPKLIRYFGNASLGTGLLLRLSHRGSAQADAADCVLANVDRDAAAERNDVGKHPLPGIGCFRELRPLGGGPPEGPRRIGLAA